MKIKALPIFVFLALSMAPSLLFALGLGGIKLNSALNQPLNAEIELIGADELALESMDIKLANDSVYERMGIERNPLVEQANFSVELLDNGQYVILVETPNNLTEPFVNFLIEVNWQAGRLLREFTVLLDPPVFLPEEAPAVKAPETELPPSFSVTTSEPDAVEAPVTLSDALAGLEEDEAEAAAPQKSDSQAAAELLAALKEVETDKAAADKSLVYPEVSKNDYLWNIAEEMRPENISVEQMMLALQRENPHAFYGNTVSHLKEGVVLRIEDASVLEELSTDEAIAEIAVQHQEWLAYRKAQQAKNAVAVESTEVELEGSGELSSVSDTETVAKAPAQPRLELVTPLDEIDAEKQAQTNVALAAADERLNQLNVELTIANEAIEASKRENIDLINRLASLEEQMSAMQSLIQLKDNELQQMQAEVSEVTGVPIEDLSSVTLDLNNEEAIEKPIIQEEDHHAQSIEKSIMQLIKDPITIATIIFIGLFLALIAWVATRRSSIEEDEEVHAEKSIDELFPEEVKDETRTKITERVEKPETADSLGVEPLTEVAFGDTQIAESNDELRDPIAEADVYLSYDKFDEAEALLLDAIDKSPDRQELKLKLLEVYSLKKDVEAFDNQADILYAAISADANNELWKIACDMASEIGSENPIFSSSEPVSSVTDSIKPLSAGKSDFLGKLPAEEGTINWEPEKVTDIADLEPLSVPETEFEVPEVQSKVIEFTANDANIEAEPTDSHVEPEPLIEEKGAVSDDELEKAMASFTDDALHEETTESDLIEQDHAVTEMLNELQTSNPDKVFDEDQSIGNNSLFLLSDEIGTKLDLAKAYIEMGDQDGAKDLLNEVLDEGDSQQQNEAKELLELT